MSEPVRVDVVDGVAVVTLTGEHDIQTRESLRARIGAALDLGGGVVADLRRATFADSTALEALVSGARTAREEGRPFVLLVPDSAAGSPVRRAVEITRLDRVMPVAGTWTEALELAGG